MTQISQMQSVFNKASKDKFLLVLTLPNILRNSNSGILSKRTEELIQLETLQFSIWGSPVPEVNVPSVSMGVQGQTYNVTSQTKAAYPPITVNFNVDNFFNNYWLLWKWLDVLNNWKDSGMPSQFAEYKTDGSEKAHAREKANQIAKNLAGKKTVPDGVSDIDFQQIRMANDFLDYQTIITIYGKDEYDKNIIQFNYNNAFITQLGGIGYNYRDPEEVESSFQFVFNQMEVNLLDTE